jgi:hypothetical protein
MREQSVPRGWDRKGTPSRSLECVRVWVCVCVYVCMCVCVCVCVCVCSMLEIFNTTPSPDLFLLHQCSELSVSTCEDLMSVYFEDNDTAMSDFYPLRSFFHAFFTFRLFPNSHTRLLILDYCPVHFIFHLSPSPILPLHASFYCSYSSSSSSSSVGSG